jgi:hypothetical protein
MQRRRACRLQFEQLEQRDVPAALFSGGHLVGCHAVHETIAAQLNGPVNAAGNIPSGLLKGTVSLKNETTSRSFLSVDFGGILTIITKKGNINLQNSGSFNILTGKVSGSGTIVGGTGAFQGATGNVSLQGTGDAVAKSINATLTGMICGPGAHHGHAHHP